MKTELDKIISNAPAWIIGVVDKIKTGEKVQRLIDIDGRSIAPAELTELIQASDQVKHEDITINVIWNNQPAQGVTRAEELFERGSI